MIIALGVHSIFRFLHLRWDESLQIFKSLVNGDWTQEFVRAIDIYTGKIKGFREVPEDKNMRELTLRAELKQLVVITI
jgi:hypothetical protein